MATAVREGMLLVQINEINETTLNEQTMKTNCLIEKLSTCTRNVLQTCCQFWTTRCCSEIKLIIRDMATGAIISIPPTSFLAYVAFYKGDNKFLKGEAIGIPAALLTGLLAKRVVERTWIVFGSIMGVFGGH